MQRIRLSNFQLSLIGLCLVQLILHGLFATLGMDVGHQGLMLKPVWDIFHGNDLFRQSFYQYGPLNAYIQYLEFLVFGNRLVGLQYGTVLAYSIILYLMNKVWGNTLSAWMLILTSLIWILAAPFYHQEMFPWPSIHVILPLIAAALGISTFFKTGRMRHLFSAGVFSAISFFIRQPHGILALLLFPGLILLLGWGYKQKRILFYLLAYIAGYGLAFFVGLLIMWNAGVLHDWWVQDIVWILGKWAFRDQSTSASLQPILIKQKLQILFDVLLPFRLERGGVFWSLLPLLTLFTFFRSTYSFFKTGESRYRQIIIFSALGVMSWHQYFPQNDFRHLYYAGTLMFWPAAQGVTWIFQAMVQALSQLFTLRKSYQVILASVLLLPIWHPFLSLELPFRVEQGLWRLRSMNLEIKEPRIFNGMYVESESQRQAIKALSETISSYQKQYPESHLTTYLKANRANLMFLCLAPRVLNYAPFVTGADESKFLYNYYQYENNFQNAIKTKHLLIYAEKEIAIPGYEVIFSRNIYPAITYMETNQMRLYAPRRKKFK